MASNRQVADRREVRRELMCEFMTSPNLQKL